jgi:hypothetical protein
VSEMAKRLSSRTIQEGQVSRVPLSTKAIKKIQALVYWVKDSRKRGMEVTAENGPSIL